MQKEAKEATVAIYRRDHFYGRRPIWVPLTDAGRPVRAATIEDAARLIAELRGGIYRLRHGEYSAPDYGVKGPDGRIRPVEP